MGCKSCTSLTCQTCESGYYLSGGACQKCIEGCGTCLDGDSCIRCKPGYTQVGSQCTPNSNREKIVSDITDGILIFTAAISSGSSLPVCFGIMTRILRNTKYLKVQVSPELQKAFYSWKPSLSLLGAPKSWSSKSESKALPWVFGHYSLEPVFLINYWGPFLMIIIGFVLFAVFKVAEQAMKKQGQKIVQSSILRYLHVAASNFALTLLYMTLDDAMFYFVIDVRSSEFDGGFRVFSLILAIVILLVGVMILGFHGYLLEKYQNLKNLKTDLFAQSRFRVFKYKCENVNLIFKDFKDITLLTQSFLLIHLLRAFLSSLVYVTLFEYPLAQVCLLLVINLGAAAFLLVKKPFADLFGFFSQLFCEIILFIALICMLIMAKFDEARSHPVDTLESLGKCVIVLNLTQLVGCAVFLIVGVLKGFYTSYQERKRAQESVKVVPKLQASQSNAPTSLNQSDQSPIDMLHGRRHERIQNSIIQIRRSAKSPDLSSISFIGQSNNEGGNATSRNLLLENSPVRVDTSPRRRISGGIEDLNDFKLNPGDESPLYRSSALNHNQSQPSSPELSTTASPQLNFKKMDINHVDSIPGERTRARARVRSRIEHLRQLALLKKSQR